MGETRAQELTLPNTIVTVVETSIVDLIAVNSGTCTGNFQTNSLSANTASLTNSITVGHVMANSGTFTGKTTANTFESNSGVFLTTLTVSGLPVSLGGGGISALVQDTSPVLGGNLNGNSKDISAVNALTANTGNFPVSMSSNTISINTASIALTATADHLVANSGTFTAKVIANTFSGNTGTFATSLTVSGLPVVVNQDAMRITFADGDGAIWTNMPTATTFLNGNTGIVQQVDLTNKTQVRFSNTKGATAGSANARLFLRYSPSFSSTATDYIGMSQTGAFATPNIQINTTNAFLQTEWEPILSAARNVVFLAVVGSGGNGTLDPVLGSIVAEFR